MENKIININEIEFPLQHDAVGLQELLQKNLNELGALKENQDYRYVFVGRLSPGDFDFYHKDWNKDMSDEESDRQSQEPYEIYNQVIKVLEKEGKLLSSEIFNTIEEEDGKMESKLYEYNGKKYLQISSVSQEYSDYPFSIIAVIFDK